MAGAPNWQMYQGLETQLKDLLSNNRNEDRRPAPPLRKSTSVFQEAQDRLKQAESEIKLLRSSPRLIDSGVQKLLDEIGVMKQEIAWLMDGGDPKRRPVGSGGPGGGGPGGGGGGEGDYKPYFFKFNSTTRALELWFSEGGADTFVQTMTGPP